VQHRSFGKRCIPPQRPGAGLRARLVRECEKFFGRCGTWTLLLRPALGGCGEGRESKNQ
jgi:hypothetical protein